MEVLNKLLEELKIQNIDKNKLIEFNQSWHRLIPWSDSLSGLRDLKENYIFFSEVRSLVVRSAPLRSAQGAT